jgi:hypothetical protein
MKLEEVRAKARRTPERASSSEPGVQVPTQGQSWTSKLRQESAAWRVAKKVFL